ncbi:MAG: hypothetical protein M0Q88_09145 [Bacilli bacterium]|nr:hypothetical protein [Bacilli bacterium]
MKSRKICFIPVYGPIIYFLIIVSTLKKENCYNIKKASGYILLMAFMGFIGMIMAGLIFRVLNLDYLFLFYILGILFVWVAITVPVLNYSKYADKLIHKDA